MIQASDLTLINRKWGFIYYICIVFFEILIYNYKRIRAIRTYAGTFIYKTIIMLGLDMLRLEVTSVTTKRATQMSR